MSLSNLPGLPQTSTLSSQSLRPSWTGDLSQHLCRWLPQVFLSQSTIPIQPCELESPCWSWVNTRTSFPLPKGTLDFQLSWRPGTVSAQEEGKTAQELSLDIRDPHTSQSWANARTYTNTWPSTIRQSLANARTLPHDPPPTKWIEWTHYWDCPQSACNMPTLSWGQSAPDANALPMFTPRSQKVEGAMQIFPNLTVTPSWYMETASANTPLFPRWLLTVLLLPPQCTVLGYNRDPTHIQR